MHQHAINGTTLRFQACVLQGLGDVLNNLAARVTSLADMLPTQPPLASITADLNTRVSATADQLGNMAVPLAAAANIPINMATAGLSSTNDMLLGEPGFRQQHIHHPAFSCILVTQVFSNIVCVGTPGLQLHKQGDMKDLL